MNLLAYSHGQSILVWVSSWPYWLTHRWLPHQSIYTNLMWINGSAISHLNAHWNITKSTRKAIVEMNASRITQRNFVGALNGQCHVSNWKNYDVHCQWAIKNILNVISAQVIVKRKYAMNRIWCAIRMLLNHFASSQWSMKHKCTECFTVAIVCQHVRTSIT